MRYDSIPVAALASAAFAASIARVTCSPSKCSSRRNDGTWIGALPGIRRTRLGSDAIGSAIAEGFFGVGTG
jgi:hypothetical protein